MQVENQEHKKVKEFAQMEKDLNLFEREYNGYKYWHMLRFSCCEATFTKRMEKEKQSRKEDKSKKTFISLCKLIFSNITPIIYYLFPKKCDILEFSISKLHNRFFNPLDFHPEFTTDLYRVDLAEPGKSKHEKHIPLLYLVLLGKIKSLQVIDKKEDEYFDEIEREITKRFGQSYSSKDMKETVVNYIKKADIYTKYFTKLIKKTHCKAILLTCYYSNVYFYLIQAAHKLKIPVIELQHGVINNHIDYWFEDNQKEYEYVPDFLLTFGTAHQNWIKLPSKEKSIIVGYPHQEKRLKELESIKTDEKLIMVYPKVSNFFESEISQLADRIVKDGYKVVVKMHPGEARNYQIYYPILTKNKNIEIITDQTNDIYYWLKKGKFHIMASSTVGLEAMQFEHTKVLISLKTEHEQCQPLLDWGSANGYQTVDELINLILQSENNLQNNKDCQNLLWKSNSVENIKNTVTMIINGV